MTKGWPEFKTAASATSTICAMPAAKDSGGATALFIASQNGHLAAVRFLLDHGAQVDLPLPTKATPLYVACQNGHLQIAEALLAFGAVPNSQTDDEATPLFIAAQMGHLEIVKKLLEFNGDVKLANRTKATPLFIAAQKPGFFIACFSTLTNWNFWQVMGHFLPCCASPRPTSDKFEMCGPGSICCIAVIFLDRSSGKVKVDEYDLTELSTIPRMITRTSSSVYFGQGQTSTPAPLVVHPQPTLPRKKAAWKRWHCWWRAGSWCQPERQWWGNSNSDCSAEWTPRSCSLSIGEESGCHEGNEKRSNCTVCCSTEWVPAGCPGPRYC